jgi:hypothetical protein
MSGFVRLAEGILFWQVQETGSRVSEGIFTLFVPNAISITSPTFTLTEAFAGFPFTITRPASHASFATVLLLMSRDTFKNLSNLIVFIFPSYFLFRRLHIPAARF